MHNLDVKLLVRAPKEALLNLKPQALKASNLALVLSMKLPLPKKWSMRILVAKDPEN